MNIGDMLTQIILLFILLVMIFGIYYTIKILFSKINTKSTVDKNIEQKLEKIIDLLEKEKKN